MDALPPVDRKPPIAQAPPPPAPPPLPAVTASRDAERADERRARRDGTRGGARGERAIERALEEWPEALRRALCSGRPIGELVAELADVLAARIAHTQDGAERDEARASLAGLAEFVLGPQLDGAGVRALATKAGPFEEGRRVAAFAGGGGAEAGLKTFVARTIARASDDATRGAAKALFDGLEREQWLELLRADVGEPRRIELACADGGRSGTAWLTWPRRGGEAGRQRVAWEIRLEGGGVARAELALSGGKLAVRLCAEEGGARARARERIAALRARLGALADVRIEWSADAAQDGDDPATAAWEVIA